MSRTFQDKNGNPPGIIREEEVDPLPPLFKQMIKRMVRWHILPPTCVPNSCIVNIYDEGDCIPPHIDHHDFLRPFCTVSFLTECNILFGSSLKILDAGEFSGPVSISLPKGYFCCQILFHLFFFPFLELSLLFYIVIGSCSEQRIGKLGWELSKPSFPFMMGFSYFAHLHPADQSWF